MNKTYSPEWWDFEHILDSGGYLQQAACADFVEEQVFQFDERNEEELADEYTPLIRAAFLSTLVAHMEHHLKKLCDVIATQRNLEIRVGHLKGQGGFDTCVLYLEKVLSVNVPEHHLKGVRRIVALRNLIVHAGGFIEPENERLLKTDDQVTKSSEGKIELGDAFIREAAQRCEKFVSAVVEELKKSRERWTRPKTTGEQRKL